MTRTRALVIIVFAALAVLVASLLLRREPEGVPRSSVPVEGTHAPPASALRPTRIVVGKSAFEPARLRPHLERLGRAVVVRDRISVEKILRQLPEIYDGDVDWIVGQTKESLFLAAGALKVVARYGLLAAIPALSGLLRSDAHVCAKDSAVDALAELGGPEAVAVLIETLRGTADASIRARAARALPRDGGIEVYNALIEVLRGEREAEVRRAAAESLRGMASPEAVQILLAALRAEPDPATRIEIALTAYAAGGESTLADLRAALGSASEPLFERLKRSDTSRYRRAYDPAFFKPGGSLVPVSAFQRTLGITVDLGTASMGEFAAELFRVAPLDRYRSFFHVRISREFEEDLAAGAMPRAYGADGLAIAGGLPLSHLDGLVFIHYVDPKRLTPGILGYTEGREAFVTRISLLHEFGHAVARLADEYSDPLASSEQAWNLCARDQAPAWRPLADQGLLPREPPLRLENVDGVDRGKWLVPSDVCFMNNHPTDDRFCPVCQLELIARICELSGAPLPW